MVIMTDIIIGKSKSNKFKRKHASSYEHSECVEQANEVSESELNEDLKNTEPSNAGWADSISKILNSKKPKRKKTLVLSKAKKLTDTPTILVKPAGFQVETAEGEIKDENIEIRNEIEAKPLKKKRREFPKLRVKTNILGKDRERTLQKIATKGVVQLFNAVKMQQKKVNKKLEEAGSLEIKRERVLKTIDKRDFLDVLMGEKSQKMDEQHKVFKNDLHNMRDSIWTVFKEDFMMGAKLKDWDKELETEVVEKNVQEIESE